MVDVLTSEQRRLNMSHIRGRDTKPEMLIRHGLYARGLRYRLHDRNLPGCPDLVFPRHQTVVFIHGCFWHMHNCKLFSAPKTRQDFWKKKLNENIFRDQKAIAALQSMDWHVLVIWECSLRGPERLDYKTVIDLVEYYITKGKKEPGTIEITGTA